MDCVDGCIANRVLLRGDANLFQVHERGHGRDAELHDADMGNDFGEILPRRGFDDKKLSGVALSIAGIFVLMNDDLNGNLFAILLALAAAIGWAVSNILMKLKFVGFNLIALTTWQVVAGAILLAIYSAFFVDTSAIWTPLSIACIAYNGILASAVAFFLWMYILSRMEASKASVSILGVPVVGVISGVIFLHEPLTLPMVFGMTMILSGIVLVQRSQE